MIEEEPGPSPKRQRPIVRRFDIVAATVRFQGGTEMNPAIDIDARPLAGFDRLDESGQTAPPKSPSENANCVETV